MADNYETSPGTGGKVFASDEIQGTGVHVPRIKVQFGVDGQATDVSENTPLPVRLDGAATAAAQATGNASMASVDSKLPALAGGKVPVTDPTALPLPTGAATAAAQATGNASMASIDSKLPALSGGRAPVESRELAQKTLIDEASSTVTYVCEAALGTATSAAAWRVQRITVTGTVTLTEWAGGGAYNQIADNRAALAYA